MPKPAYPADLPTWVANYQGIRGYRIKYDRSGAYKCIGSDFYATDNGCIGSYGRSFSNPSRFILTPAIDGRPRSSHIGEHTGRTQKNILFAMHAAVYRHIVLNLYIAAKLNSRKYDHVLSDIAGLSYLRLGHYMREVPDFHLRTY